MAMDNNQIRYYILVLAVAVMFFGFGIWELINPIDFGGYVTMNFGMDVNLLVRMHGIMLVLVGLSLVTGFFAKIGSIVGTLMIGHIIVTLWMTGFSDLIIRDVALMLVTLSMYFEDHKSLSLFGKKI